MTGTLDNPQTSHASTWPALPLETWRDTCDTLHMWTQVVGKVRLAQAPLINHWWEVPLYVTCRGLTTSPIPFSERCFQVDFDFIDHHLTIQTGDGAMESFPLRPCSVAAFHDEFMQLLHKLDLPVQIWTMPVEVANPVRFKRITSTRPTTPIMRTASGAFCSRPIGCSPRFARASPARSVRSISSG